MSYFYVLQVNNGTYYYGSTRDMRQRYDDHVNGPTKLKDKRPLELLYFEWYPAYTQARKREIAVKKNAAMREELKKRLGYGPVV